MLLDISFVIILMVLNGIFAGAEIAILSVRRTRLAQLLEAKEHGAKAVFWLRHQPERFLATVQIGITIVGTTAAALGGERLAQRITLVFKEIPAIGEHASWIGFWCVVLGISFLEIVIGELVPKSLALRSAEKYSLAVGPALRLMASLAKPAVWMLTHASNAVLRFFDDKTSFTEARLSPEELQELLEEAGRVGSLDRSTSEIASRALDFRDLRAVDVMVPRTRMVAVSKDIRLEDLHIIFEKHRFARLPVYDEAPENIVGYISMKDVLIHVLTKKTDSIEQLIRPVKYIPRTAKAGTVLEQFRQERKPFAIVVDESGGVVGLMTIEDLIEELVGDIMNEYAPDSPEIKYDVDGSALVPGVMPIRDVSRTLDVDLPEPEGYTTIAGLCMHLAEGVPEPRTILKVNDMISIEILESSLRTVIRVKILKSI